MPGQMFIPLLKVDAARRLVYGSIDETPDRAAEVFDYASSKPQFQKWSSDISKASGGKSFGNVRAMHGNVAAGLLKSIHFDDAAKRIDFEAHIVDDGEWEKCQTGVYTGFSPGGSYVKRWKDGDLTRYTAKPSEISIVDLPCIPSAGFTLVKADGIEEQVLFKGGSNLSAADADRAQAIHDHAVSMGACCSGDGADKAAPTGDLAKMAGDLAKAEALHQIAVNDLAKMTGARDGLMKRVSELEKLAAPSKVLRSFSKGDELTQQDEAVGDTDSGTFDERLAAIEKMAAGPDKVAALRKLAADERDDALNDMTRS